MKALLNKLRTKLSNFSAAARLECKYYFRPDLHPDYDLTAKAKRLIAEGKVRYNGKESAVLLD